MKAVTKTNPACPSCRTCSEPLSICLAPGSFDQRVSERLAFVNSVCAVLIDSRFGPGRVEPLIHRYSREQKVDRPILYDMTAAGPVPSYSILPDSEMARRYANAIILDAMKEHRRTAGASLHVQNILPPQSARGSP